MAVILRRAGLTMVVILLSGLALLGRRGAIAQDPTAVAQTYVTNVLLGPGDMQGYGNYKWNDVDLNAVGAIAGRTAYFNAQPLNTKPLNEVQVWVYAMPTEQLAQAFVDDVKGMVIVRTPDGVSVRRQWTRSYKPERAEAGELYSLYASSLNNDRTNAFGMIWRRGLVVFHVIGGGEVTVPTSISVREDEVIRIGDVQNRKALLQGPLLLPVGGQTAPEQPTPTAVPPALTPTASPAATVEPSPPSSATPSPTPSPTPPPTPVATPSPLPTSPPPVVATAAPSAPSPAPSPSATPLSPTVTPAATATPPPPTPTTDPEVSVFVLALVREGAAAVRDGTPILAQINGRECGRAETTNGFVAIEVLSRDARAGCGAAGATIRFRIGDFAAAQSVPWTHDAIVQLQDLSRPGSAGGRGRVVVPLLDTECRPPAAEAVCSATDRALWAGNLAAWNAEFERRGEVPRAEPLVSTWLRFRAERGEIFGALALAILEERSYIFIAGVQYAATSDIPIPFVSLVVAGRPLDVSGWTLNSVTGASYTFPEGTVLPIGECRVMSQSTTNRSTCPNAAFTGANPALGAPGKVWLRNANGEFVDLPVEWSGN